MRKIRYESELEESAAYFFIAQCQTRELREQQKVQYVLRGTKHNHWIDFIKREAGRRVAYFVKYQEDVDRDLREMIQLVCDQVGDRVADEFRLFTQHCVTRTQIENAMDIVDCGGDYDFKGQSIVEATLLRLPSQVALGEIAEASGLANRGFRAAVTLIQKGLLVVPKNVRLGDQAILVNRSANGGRR